MDTARDRRIRATLDTGLAELGLQLSDPTRRALLNYVAILQIWNRVYNLTAVRDPVEMVRRHLLDSLAVLPYIQGPRLLDIGTGAGLPGMVLALARPDIRCVLLDKSAKKIRFCLAVIAELGIRNAVVIRTRVEQYGPDGLFSTVIARAVGPIGQLLPLAHRLQAPGGCLLVMKGTDPQAELQALAELPDHLQVIRLEVPGVVAPRHLVIIRLSV